MVKFLKFIAAVIVIFITLFLALFAYDAYCLNRKEAQDDIQNAIAWAQPSRCETEHWSADHPDGGWHDIDMHPLLCGQTHPELYARKQ